MRFSLPPCVSFLFIVVAGCQSALPQTVPTATNDSPITSGERLQWLITSTVGPSSLAGGVVSSGWGTLFNAPREYGPHWDGFGKRYGLRLSGVATGNTMEAGLGALWGEDPRYERAAGRPFRSRVGNILKMSVLAHDERGRLVPAYARYAAVSGNNFLSNAWRPDSEATVGHALVRTVTGFLARMAGNAFSEFWPDVTDRISKRNSPPRP